MGLYLGSSAVIGDQKHSGNIWDGTYYDFAAVHTGLIDIVEYSPFIYDKTDNTFLEPPTIDASIDWFFNQLGSTFLCESEEVCPEGIGYSGFTVNWDSLDLDLISGDLGFEQFDSELSWMGRFHTYRRLHNSGLTLPTPISNFLTTQQSLNIGKFSNAFDSLRIAVHYTGDLESILDDFPLEFSQYSKYIHTWDSLILEGRNRDSLTTLIISENGTIELTAESFLEKLDLIDTYLEGKVNNAISYTEAITPGSDQQEALKFTLLEFMNYLESDTLANSQDIYNLALECPDEFGDAVYHARSLIRLDSLINYFNDDNECGYINPRSYNLISSQGVLFPNPANNQTTIAYLDDIMRFSLFNSSGIEFDIPIEKNQKSIIIYTHTLPDGLYFITIQSKSNDITNYKLIVVH